MSNPLNVLIVEDSESDAAMMARLLRKAGYDVRDERVEAADEMRAALEKQAWDVVICDYRLPQFDAPAALALLQGTGLDIPFIIVSGTVGEDTAVAMIKVGAHDYLMKDRLTRLAPAVEQALEQKRLRDESRRAEAALRQSEERLRLALTATRTGVWEWNVQKNVVFWSPECYEILGVQDFGLTFEAFVGLVHPEDKARFIALSNEALTQKQDFFALEFRIIRPDGEMIWLSDLGRVEHDETGKPLRVIGTNQDITERKRAEDELRESEIRYRTLFQASSDGILIADLESRIFRYANPAICRLLGYSEAELRMMGVADIHPKADLPAVLAEFEAQVRGDKTLAVGLPCLRKDGTIVYADIIAGAMTIDGRACNVGFFRDITERKRMEKSLQEKVIALQTLAEIDREIIATSEPQGILDLVCRRAAELVHAQKSAIMIETSPGEMGMAASYGLVDPVRSGEEFARLWQASVLRPGVLGLHGALAKDDITADAPYMPELRAREDVRTYAVAPLAAGEKMLGALVVLDTAPRVWTADEIQVLNMLAGQTAIALEKVRLYEAARNRAAHLETLNTIGQAITSTLDLDQVLSALLECVARTTDAEACSVALVEVNTGDLVFRQATGPAGGVVIGTRLKPVQGVAGWVVAHQQSALVPDAASDPRFYDNVDGTTGFTTRNVVCVPLIAHDAVIGVLELVNKRSGTFGEDDTRLLESVAAQAAIAIENARLFEAEHAGRQRLETLYRIGQAINSTLDAGAILDRLTDEAMRATRATHGSALVALPDLGCFERRSLRGYSPELAEQARATRLPLNHGVNGRAYHTRQVVCVDDVQADPNYFPLVPDSRAELAMPILRGGQVLGNLDLQSPEIGAFRDVDLGLLQALTDQVAIALENARLFEETRRHLDELAVVSYVALIGAAGRPFDETVARATDSLIELWLDVNVSFLFVDEADQSLRLHPSARGVPPEIIASLRIPLNQGITGWVARERLPVRVGDVTADPRYAVAVGMPGAASEMAAPLVTGERVIGVVNIESPRLNAFSGDDLRLLTTLAGQLATIFEKARLDAALEAERASLARRVEERTAELRVANEQLRLAHEQVSRALDKERELGELKSRFISTTSHEFRTPLSTILSSSELLEHYGSKWMEEKKLQHLHRIQAAVHNMVQLLDDVLIIGRAEAGKLEFKPAPLNLTQFCHDLVEEMQLAAGPHYTIAFSGSGEGVDAHVDEKLLRQILSNLLSNAIKYSLQGSTVQLELVCREGEAIFRVRDEGIGIPPEDQARLFESFHRAGNVGNIPGTGLGLTIVKKSVDLQGGTITVDSRVGVGTTFVVTIPLHPAAQEEST